ncbi:MAG: hypothetical protein AAFP20_25055, partial [Cyanobacteria bacterium J06614_10]
QILPQVISASLTLMFPLTNRERDSSSHPARAASLTLGLIFLGYAATVGIGLGLATVALT